MSESSRQLILAWALNSSALQPKPGLPCRWDTQVPRAELLLRMPLTTRGESFNPETSSGFRAWNLTTLSLIDLQHWAQGPHLLLSSLNSPPYPEASRMCAPLYSLQKYEHWASCIPYTHNYSPSDIHTLGLRATRSVYLKLHKGNR